MIDETVTPTRWDYFTDEELASLRWAVALAASSRLDWLSNEVAEEQVRRDEQRPSYRGPGRYRHVTAGALRALGYSTSSSGPVVVICWDDLRDDQLSLIPIEQFDGRIGGVRTYEYVGPLEEDS